MYKCIMHISQERKKRSLHYKNETENCISGFSEFIELYKPMLLLDLKSMLMAETG